MDATSMDELRQLVADNVFPAGTPFEFKQAGPGTYYAIFSGNELPRINEDVLKRKLSAEAAFKHATDHSSYDSAFIDGQYKGQKVRLFLVTEAGKS